MTKRLTVMRHAERKMKDVEDLSNRGKKLAGRAGKIVDGFLGRPEVIVASDMQRTSNTANAMGYEVSRTDSGLSYSNHPTGELGICSFGGAHDLYRHNPIPQELGDSHARIYREIVNGMNEGEHGLIITHDLRAELALASLVNGQVSLGPLGKCLDYGEGYSLGIDGDEIRSVEMIRNPVEFEGLKLGGRK